METTSSYSEVFETSAGFDLNEAISTTSDIYPITSKVLVFEKSEIQRDLLKQFFKSDELLQGIQAKTYKQFKNLLDENLDLGGIFIGENVGKGVKGGLPSIIFDIRAIRPELPIFIRTKGNSSEYKIPYDEKDGIIQYQLSKKNELQELIATHILNIEYPNLFVHGIQEITRDVLNCFLPLDSEKLKLFCCVPYLVRDRYIESSLFSMIHVTSDWCKGHMITEVINQDLLKHFTTLPLSISSRFRLHGINDILGELTNMVWGGIQSRFIKQEELFDHNRTDAQLPIVVNDKHISFGSICPQLCFRYLVFDKIKQKPVLEIGQRFIFNNRWSPDVFTKQNQQLGLRVPEEKLNLV